MADEDVKKAVDDALAVREAKKPRALELEAYDQLYLDNILWRERAAKAAQELANRDLIEVANMRGELLKKLRTKYKLEPDWTITLDQVRKTAIAERK